MLRRFFGNTGFENERVDTEDERPSSLSSPVAARTPPPMAFKAEEKQREVDANTLKVKELAPFDICIEACDELASTSTSSGRVDSIAGLVDCSVLVSPDGDLLIIPQDRQNQTHKEKEETSSNKYQEMQALLHRTSIELGEEYKSSIFLGNDLQIHGDKILNGFSAKGWSIPAASLALKQSVDVMEGLSEFLEDLVLTKKSCAAQESQVVNRLRPMVEGPENGGMRVSEYQDYLKENFPNDNVEVLPFRVGPISAPGGTIQETLCALESYYSSSAESESMRWKRVAGGSGPLQKLKSEQAKTKQRAANREAALKEMFRRTKAVEEHLLACKEDAARKWEEVHEAEEQVTKLVEEKMMERSRLRQQQRLEQLKLDEQKRAQDAAHGNLGATSSEIWDIVSAVAASMEEGSFEPMDLPQAPLAAPRDKSRGSEMGDDAADQSEEELPSLPIASRHELEEECRLPELRVAALAAADAVNDAANVLLSVLANWDSMNRSSRLAAETCLVNAANAQASCLRGIIAAERDAINERQELLKELEELADQIDVRADMDHYITIDKREKGGRSFLGDDDDGGIASALAVLNNHIDGDMGMGTSRNFRNSVIEPGNEDTNFTPEQLEESVEEFFRDNELLKSDAPDNEKTQKAREEFEITVLKLCKAGKERSSAGRSRRSTICYSMNAKRSHQSEIKSELQFEGLCRVFTNVLASCDTDDASGSSVGKMMMTLSQTFCLIKDNGEEVYVKSKLVDHPLWQNDQFWDQALYQTVAESLTHSGVMSNFEHPASGVLTARAKKKSEWTEAYKFKWHDLKENERYDAASQVHAVVFAQIGALAHAMMEFGCGLERSCAFARRMAVRNQLPMSQRAMLLQHLMGRETDGDTANAPAKDKTPES